MLDSKHKPNINKHLDRYNKIREVSHNLGEYNDCSVTALAMIYELDYMQAHRICRDQGRLVGKAFNTMCAIRQLGRESKMFYPKQPNGSKYTIKTIPSAYPIGKFFVWTDGHVAAMIDGTVYDWTEDRKHRVIKMQEIDKIDFLNLL